MSLIYDALRGLDKDADRVSVTSQYTVLSNQLPGSGVSKTLLVAGGLLVSVSSVALVWAVIPWMDSLHHDDVKVVALPQAVMQEPKAVAVPQTVVQKPKVVAVPQAVVQEPKAVAVPQTVVQKPKVVAVPQAVVQKPKAVAVPQTVVQKPKVVAVPQAVVQKPKVVAVPQAVVQKPKVVAVQQAVVQKPKVVAVQQAVVKQPKSVAVRKTIVEPLRVAAIPKTIPVRVKAEDTSMHRNNHKSVREVKVSRSDQRRSAIVLANKVRLLIREGKLDQVGEYMHQLESVSGVDSLVSLRIRAYWMLSSNKDRNALSIYHQILSREPNDVSANLNTALAEWRLGHPQEASIRLKKFLDKNPANKQARSMLNQLRKIR